MTDKLREAAQMALDAMLNFPDDISDDMFESIKALRAALANEFNPDWDAMAVMVEVQQRMAKRIEELESALTQPEKERDRGGACVVVDGTSGVFTVPLPGKPGGGGISLAQPDPPPECKTEEEKRAFAFGWWKALEANKAQPEQEPPCKTGSQCVGNKCERCAVQPEREWIGLTDEEIKDTLEAAGMDTWFSYRHAARAIEAKLKEKNGAI